MKTVEIKNLPGMGVIHIHNKKRPFMASFMHNNIGSGGRARTDDQFVNSELLYH